MAEARRPKKLPSSAEFQEPTTFLWRRVLLLAATTAGSLVAIGLVALLVDLWLPRAPASLLQTTAVAFAVTGAAIMVAGLTRQRRFPGEAFAAGGLVLWCIATLMSDGVVRSILTVPAFLLAWGSLAVDLAADTRMALFAAHLLPLDAALDDWGLETGFGNLTGILVALYLLALLVVLPRRGPWRNVVAGFAGCAIVTALIVGVAFASWTWRAWVFLAAVVALGAVVYVLWRRPIERSVPLLLRRRAEHPPLAR